MKATLLSALLAVSPALAASPKGRTIDLAVTEKGFEPTKMEVKKGEPVHLMVTRKTDKTCATELVIKDADLRKKLPLNEAVAFEFTPKKGGEIKYVCGMGMLEGVLLVQ